MKNLLFTLCLLFPWGLLWGQYYHFTGEQEEREIDSMMNRIGTAEKPALLGGYKNGRLRPVRSIGIPELRTAYLYQYPPAQSIVPYIPSIQNLAASWDTSLVRRVAQFQAEKVAAAADMLIGLNLNLYRYPLDKDNFLHGSEDPFLNGLVAAAWVKGIQSRQVMAAPTGFVAAYQAYTDKQIEVQGEERALEELYLTPYRMAVTRGKAAAVVTAHNGINGEKSSESATLLTNILKGTYLFEGAVIADTAHTYNTLPALRAGLDLELPNARHLAADSLKSALQQQLSPQLLDDKIRRRLRLFTYFQRNQTNSLGKTGDDAQLQKEIAAASLILLKNEENFLPIASEKLPSLALIGPFANASRLEEGYKAAESSWWHQSSLHQSLQKVYAAESSRYRYESGLSTWEEFAQNNLYFTDENFLEGGLKVYGFDNPSLEGKAILETKLKLPELASLQLPTDLQSLRISGVFEPEMTGEYLWKMSVSGGIRVYLNGNLFIDEWEQKPLRTVEITFKGTKDELLSLEIQYLRGREEDALRAIYTPPQANLLKKAVDAAEKAEIAVVCVGYDLDMEQNGRTWTLPAEQINLLNAVAAVNKKMIVVLSGGGSVDVQSWKHLCKAIFYTSYLGPQTGLAVSDALFGKLNPQGKLPFSWEKNLEDNVVFPFVADKDLDKKVNLGEKWNLGYRHYVTEQEAAKPEFPFGFGLAYTSFDYKNLTVEPNNYKGEGELTVSFDVFNTGKADGTATPQLYLKDIKAAQLRPAYELKGFAKVFLKAGESKRVTIKLSAEELAFYHADKHIWIAENGIYEAHIGQDALNLMLKAPFMFNGERVFEAKKRRGKGQK